VFKKIFGQLWILVLAACIIVSIVSGCAKIRQASEGTEPRTKSTVLKGVLRVEKVPASICGPAHRQIWLTADTAFDLDADPVWGMPKVTQIKEVQVDPLNWTVLKCGDLLATSKEDKVAGYQGQTVILTTRLDSYDDCHGVQRVRSSPEILEVIGCKPAAHPKEVMYQEWDESAVVEGVIRDEKVLNGMAEDGSRVTAHMFHSDVDVGMIGKWGEAHHENIFHVANLLEDAEDCGNRAQARGHDPVLLGPYLGKHVRLTGGFYFQDNGHQFTHVLFSLKKLVVLDCKE
jgi:hypothetical protein